MNKVAQARQSDRNSVADPQSIKPLSVVFMLVVMAAVLLVSELVELRAIAAWQVTSLGAHLLIHFGSDFVALLIGAGILYLPIRKRQQAQQQLAAAVILSENRYRTLVESLDVGVALIDADRRPLMVNQAMRDLGCVAGATDNDVCYRFLFGRDTPCSGCLADQVLASRTSEQFELNIEETESTPWRCLKIKTIPTPGGGDRADGFIEVVEDVTSERQAQREIQELSRRLTEAAEEERKLLAQELHDQCGQVLAAVQFKIEFLKSRLAADNPELQGEFDRVGQLVAGVGEDIRQVTSRLRPPILDESGLAETLEWLTRLTLEQNPGLEIDLDLQDLPQTLPADLETTIYRVVQEALANVSRHAGADQVGIELRCDGTSLSLQIVDNGCGFETETVLGPDFVHCIGLRGMQKRIRAHEGVFKIDSRIGRGTRITAILPVY